jgi:photosystem II stability/assembly factor-like uncharacterized protein
MRAAAGVAAVLLAVACTNGGHPAARPTGAVTAPVTPSLVVDRTPPARPTLPPDDPACMEVRGTRPVTGRPLAFAGPRTGVVGYGSALYRTTDGARTWRFTKDLGGDTSDLVPAGCGTFYVAMTDGRLYRSLDAGATWWRVGTAHVDTLDFVTPRVGFGFGAYGPGPLYRTADGGATWQRVPAFGRRVNAFTAATPRLLLAATARGLLRSDDGGATVTNVLPQGISNVTFAPGGRHAWAYGLTTDERYRDTYHVWHSADGGLHWRVVASGPNPDTTGPDPDPTMGVRGQLAAYGAAALLPGYSDTRNGVTLVTAGSRHAVLPVRYAEYNDPHGLDTMQWVDATHAYAFDTVIGGHLFATSDGGRSWREVPTP